MSSGKSKPNIYIIAGPNGAGKTTFATKFLPKYAKCDNFVNPDLIAKGLSPFSPEDVALKAGRLLLQQIHELADKGEEFAFETTLSGVTYLNILKEFKKKGYSVKLFYLWVPDIELALGRIRERVARGGHNVPSKDVRRRYKRSLRNLFHKYRSILDGLMIFDNSTEKFHVIAKEEEGNLVVLDREKFDKIKATV